MSVRKLKVVLTRRLPDAVETRMRELFDAELNLKDQPMDRAALEAGLVHADDARGNAERLSQAQRFTSVGGIGSECGWGRADPVKLDAIIAAHRSLIGV